MSAGSLAALFGSDWAKILDEATALAPTESNRLTVLQKLRKKYPAKLANIAVEIVVLRPKARLKFALADKMVFDREGLEMASGEVIAKYRAERFRSYERVVDVGCGIGGDAIALASVGCQVIAIDKDPIRLAYAGANISAHGYGAKLEEADVTRDLMPQCDAAFADPGRRPNGRRVLSIDEYEPTVQQIEQWFPKDFPLAIKVAPGISRADQTRYEVEAEFISVSGELRECVLWFGPLKTATVRATLLPSRLTYVGKPDLYVPATDPMQYLYDPDPALSRAQLVGALAEEWKMELLDVRGTLLTSDRLVNSPFADCYRIEAVLTPDVKKIGHYLREHDIGRITPIKRGSNIDTDALLKKLKLKGELHRELYFTNSLGNPVAIVVERV